MDYSGGHRLCNPGLFHPDELESEVGERLDAVLIDAVDPDDAFSNQANVVKFLKLGNTSKKNRCRSRSGTCAGLFSQFGRGLGRPYQFQEVISPLYEVTSLLLVSLLIWLLEGG
ncbi:hypothetical protein [Bradyrhizobium sp. CCBAU 051011]|uniref:hypothetical protein n=1 Tax=Bradyrhizobium sp. CCBAU 051011 TaxID=858422 RepID=UPI00137AA57F|nr:hypothetical protein [Bradyrhizobium sp. CCBAU 051011]